MTDMAFHIYRLGNARTIRCVVYLLAVVCLIAIVGLSRGLNSKPFSDSRNNTGFFHPRNIKPVVKMHEDLEEMNKPVMDVKNDTKISQQQKQELVGKDERISSSEFGNEPPCYDVHAFYYPWYGNPDNEGKYLHWNHEYIQHWNKKEAQKWPKGRHSPPDDIGANYFPSLGPYSSSDRAVVDVHMQMMRQARIGVVVVSWYPPGDADNEGKNPDTLMPMILDAADKQNLKVAIHVEPYKNRTANTLRDNLSYIMKTYGSHPAFYRRDFRGKKNLPLYYIYDSYLTDPEDWAKILMVHGQESVRSTELDGIFIGLFVEEKHGAELSRACFDGFYTYFATNEFTYGSSWKNWGKLSSIAKSQQKLFIPSVGPGYIDTQVRPWNKHNTRERANGSYYDTSFTNALKHSPDIISITSFNEWHEGTQIEPAIVKSIPERKYLDYLPNKPDFYLKKTRDYVTAFMNHERI